MGRYAESTQQDTMQEAEYLDDLIVVITPPVAAYLIGLIRRDVVDGTNPTTADLHDGVGALAMFLEHFLDDLPSGLDLYGNRRRIVDA